MRTIVIATSLVLLAFGCAPRGSGSGEFGKTDALLEPAPLDDSSALLLTSSDADAVAGAARIDGFVAADGAAAQDAAAAIGASGDPTGLAPFASGDELLAWLRAAGQVLPATGARGAVPAPAFPDLSAPAGDPSVPVPVPTPVPMPTPSPTPTPVAGDSGRSGSFSATMVQDAGVDEPDRVKTDGRRLYVVSDRVLSVIDASSPSAMREIARIELPAQAQSLFLLKADGKTRAVVLVQQVLYAYEGDSVPGPDGAPGCDLRVHAARCGAVQVDVSDPGAPRIEACRFVDGLLYSARRRGDALALVVRRPRSPLPSGTSAGDAAETFCPRASESLAGPGARLFGAEEILHGAPSPGALLVSLVTVDLADGLAVRGAAGFLGDPSVLYVSLTSLYAAAAADAAAGPATRIHRFDLGNGGVRYAGSAEVPGRLLDSLSLGEHRGFLRCATFEAAGAGSTRVTVLRLAGTGLPPAGALSGIAAGEQFDAARFLGDRGYLSTSVRRLVDPLFVLDRSVPCDPRVLGSFDLPGFCGRLLPVSETALLSLGRDGNGGLQVSLFDLSDPASPALAGQVGLAPAAGWFWVESEALSQPLAFQWHAEEGLLALPLHVWGSVGNWWCNLHWEEVAVLRVRGTEIERIGAVNTTTADTGESLTWWWWCYGCNPWTRAVFAGGSVYAVTRQTVRAAEVGETVGEGWDLALK
jgi:hypothetical protein